LPDSRATGGVTASAASNPTTGTAVTATAATTPSNRLICMAAD
jgi:hypothetical protein